MDMNTVKLQRDVPIIGRYDVIVVGGGPAGICAATASARCGASTALVERYGIIGGNLTIGHVGPIMGGVSNGTLKDEVREVLKVKGIHKHHDIEEAKINLTAWINSTKTDLFLQAHVVDVIKEESVIKGIVMGGQNGLSALMGQIIVDATGDGTVSYLAGADYKVGRDSDGLVQPTTLMFTLAGIDESKAITCGHEEDDSAVPGGSYLEICKKANREGELPQNVNIVRLYRTLHDGERMVNATQANGIDGTKYSDIAKAEVDLRNQIQVVHAFLKKYVPGFEESYIRDSADTIGVRETRRIIGEYILQDEDLTAGRKFEDVMVHNASFVIDIHNPAGAGQAETTGCPHKVQPYDIPYRCFVPLKIENLLMAGRCISGTHRALASYRVMNICLAMGQAVGVAAAFSARSKAYPRLLDYHTVQKYLVSQGANLYD